MKTGMEAALEDIGTAASMLANLARDAGVVVTIEQRPLEPLAMGHHYMHVSVRPARVPAGDE